MILFLISFRRNDREPCERMPRFTNAFKYRFDIILTVFVFIQAHWIIDPTYLVRKDPRIYRKRLAVVRYPPSPPTTTPPPLPPAPPPLAPPSHTPFALAGGTTNDERQREREIATNTILLTDRFIEVVLKRYILNFASMCLYKHRTGSDRPVAILAQAFCTP